MRGRRRNTAARPAFPTIDKTQQPKTKKRLRPLRLPKRQRGSLAPARRPRRPVSPTRERRLFADQGVGVQLRHPCKSSRHLDNDHCSLCPKNSHQANQSSHQSRPEPSLRAQDVLYVQQAKLFEHLTIAYCGVKDCPCRVLSAAPCTRDLRPRMPQTRAELVASPWRWFRKTAQEK